MKHENQHVLHKVCFVIKKTKVSSSVINEDWQIIMSNHCALRWYGAVLQESNSGGGVYQRVAIATAQDSGGWSGSVRHVKHKPNRWRIWMLYLLWRVGSNIFKCMSKRKTRLTLGVFRVCHIPVRWHHCCIEITVLMLEQNVWEND